jgi:succinyl-diaminopimelate desuccinylase
MHGTTGERASGADGSTGERASGAGDTTGERPTGAGDTTARDRTHQDVLRSTDLLTLTAALVAVPSVSGDEQELADLVERRLRARAPRLTVHRVGNNVVARTEDGTARAERVVLAGHLDTVPVMPRGPEPGGAGTVRGLGAVDMKGGLAVMLLLAEQTADSAFDLTFVFYDKEEIGSRRSGMNLLFAEHRPLVVGDLAILLEPTGGAVEAGCQGNLVVELGFDGTRAHTARPWQGVNAIHRAAAALARIAEHTPEPAVIDGLAYRQAMSVVAVEGGVQGNVVPDRCTVRVNFRHAASLDSDAAAAVVTGLAPEADDARVLLSSPPAPPDLRHPLVAALCAATNAPVRPKLGWTDVGRFAVHGIPAVNFGPGDSELAHGPNEVVSEEELADCHAALYKLLSS